MTAKRKVSPLQVMSVFIKEDRIRRIQKRRKGIAGKIRDLQAEIETLEDEDSAWSDREDALTWEIEESGVYDD